VPGSMIVVAETIMESCKAADQWLKFKTSVETTETTVRNLLDSGNEEEALKLLSQLRTNVLKLEEASWREQWLMEWNKRFGHIWERAKKSAISLSSAVRG
jgi:ParB-like chromosome segregation protein Spo0J